MNISFVYTYMAYTAYMLHLYKGRQNKKGNIKMKTDKLWYTTKDLADAVGYSIGHVNYLIRKGKILGKKINPKGGNYRIPRKEYNRLIKGEKQEYGKINNI